MSSTNDPIDLLASLERPAPPRGRPFVAWFVILAVFAGLAAVQLGRGEARQEVNQDDATSLGVMQMQAKGLLGLTLMAHERDPAISAQVDALNQGPVTQRLCFVVLRGELSGPAIAIETLAALDDKLAGYDIQMTDVQRALRAILGRLYDDYAHKRWDAPSVGPADRDQLRRHMRWFGDLALAPAAGPDRELRASVIGATQHTAFVLFGVAAWFLFFGLLGLVGLVVFPVLLLANRVASRLGEPSGYGAIYAETFACWIVLFVSLSAAVEFAQPVESRILAAGLASLASLLALIWPVLRGVPWKQVRRDIGLSFGDNVAIEPVCGIACYATSLPLAAVALLITFLALVFGVFGGEAPTPHHEFANAPLPVHPVVGEAAMPGTWGSLPLILMATVFAPLVEEIMFRGVLYRHLRDCTATAGIVVSALSSGLVSAFLFAAVHPQGPIAVPALMVLALGFTFAREWRGSLVAPIAAHALNNAVLVTILLQAIG